MNKDNLSPAMTKAIENGGTNNTIIGNALVKRGIFVEAASVPGENHAFAFVPVSVQPEVMVSQADEIETAEKTIEAVKQLPAPTFTLSEEEIEENAAVKLGDTIRRDSEIQAERRDAREKQAREAIEDAQRVIQGLSLPTVDLHAAMASLETARHMLTSETPWEAFRIARRTAEMWPRVVRLRSEFKDAPDWRKERITAALATMGTVVYPEGTSEYAEYNQNLTAALSEYKTTGEKRYRIDFQRIGRQNSPAPLYVATFETEEAFQTKIRRYASKFLASREFDVDVEIVGETGTVLLDGGRFGKGSITLDS